VPVVLVAGALKYSRRKFIAAMALGRGVRYFIVAGLGAIYGDAVVSFFSKYYKPALFTLIGFAVIGAVLAYLQYRKYRKEHPNELKPPARRAA
jgi:membrane protein DedA with SNARE-associated domain